MTDEKRRSYTDSEREKMDRGASMIPDAVENLWLAKRHLVNLRDMLLAGNLEAARRLLDELLIIKSSRANRRRPPLWMQFSTSDGVMVARGQTTGYNENGLGARGELFWQDPTASTKATDLANRPGTVSLYCPPGEYYPYPLPAKLLRIEACNALNSCQAFVAIEFTPAIPENLLEALTDWAEQCAKYQASQEKKQAKKKGS